LGSEKLAFFYYQFIVNFLWPESPIFDDFSIDIGEKYCEIAINKDGK